MTLEEIKRGETERLEFKREVPKHDRRYLKTVVAFANGLGGSIVFGIDDKTLEVVGVADEELRKIEDGLASAISSACTPAVGNVGKGVGNVGNAVAEDADIEQIAMDSLRGDGKVSAAKMAKIAKVTTRTIERALVRLKASGRIRRRGGTRGVWEIIG